MTSVLIIEDSLETQLILKKYLETKYQVHICSDLASSREVLKTRTIDLILLDLNLPDGPGLSLLKDLGANFSAPRIPTIILSAANDLKTRVIGLESGADDYMLKPFEALELTARIESVLRRGQMRQPTSTISFADVVIDLNNQIASHRQPKSMKDLCLTPIELRILMTFIRESGSEISRDDLTEGVWGQAFVSKRNVDTHICKLRKKLENTKIAILNKRDRGYFISVLDEPSKQIPNSDILLWSQSI